ncbi:glutathione synthase [Candidatus Kinetoplastidibacterium crithidiae]|uniref:Glutathione synthetase n=1 Tax=Candidatus Kinetoplastidibacterium crithidiae TCC036E TaxID=1208918 RepID=M1LTT3_9PROT|nr:glutathione synthase [Candidatus Kinetoplastibacterium crithidii]AFZ82831.1 glutathione synthetase [Candidatus Kinetoplastibacterium crithidii (ex Angomonas deanei ATCC 30255)]AGF47516.1 glutathione synthase [Candidatus Kinetoplastibacterium crithidii TCC036E]
MHVLFIIDPLISLSAYKDTSVSIMISLISRGYDVSVATQTDLFIDPNGEVIVSAKKLFLKDNINLSSNDWFITDSVCVEIINIFDIVLVRKDPPFDMEYFYLTHILEIAKNKGVKIINDPTSLRNYSEKLSILNFPELIMPTLVSSNINELKKFCFFYNDIILKPLDGMGGSGIFRLKKDDPNLNVILETSTNNAQRTVMVQKYIPEITQGDKRVILINNKIVPYCLARIPKKGESRGNLAVGGHGVAQLLSESDIKIAESVGSFLEGKGLSLVGLDIIGKSLTEINVTSPTCFVEITNSTKFDVAGMFIDYLESIL